MKNRKILFLAFLMSSVVCFGQKGDKKGTIKVKKIPTETKTIDSSATVGTVSLMVVDQMPQFAGENTAMYAFIQKNIKFPEAEKKAKIQGTVILGFIVEADGSITNVRTVKGILNGSGCDREAMRVVQLMPNWIPGKQTGKNVAVAMTLQIKFML
jgi:protein TonB